MKNYFLLPLLFLSLLFFSCNESDSDSEVIENGSLVSSTERFNNSRDKISTLLAVAGINNIDQYLVHGIQLYTIEYTTDYLGEQITASGLVAFPDTNDEMPILSFQHGTMASHDEAPTLSETYSFLSNLASTGYIFIIPDLIGFGSSSDKLHPYYNYEMTATSVIDMVKATTELAKHEGYNFDGNLFLAGYSEGGYCTMAAHKYMEDNPLDDIKLIASAPSSGGYDVKGMQEYFFSLDTYDNPFFLGYVAMSYLSVYTSWTITLDDFFNEPYATRMPGLFDGSLSGGDINDQLTTKVDELLSPTFLNGLDSKPLYTDLVQAFEDNSLDHWIPKIKMTMYHGDADITVPYQNSVDSYDNMISLGASKKTLKFVPLPGGTHGSGFLPYLEAFIKEFDELK